MYSIDEIALIILLVVLGLLAGVVIGAKIQSQADISKCIDRATTIEQARICNKG